MKNNTSAKFKTGAELLTLLNGVSLEQLQLPIAVGATVHVPNYGTFGVSCFNFDLTMPGLKMQSSGLTAQKKIYGKEDTK